MKHILAILTLAIASAALLCEPLPDSPKPQCDALHFADSSCFYLPATYETLNANLAWNKKEPLIDRTDIVIWSAIGVAHAANYILDQQCFRLPQRCHEVILPGFVWKNSGVLALAHGFFSGAQIAISVEMRKHHHKKLARAWDVANLVAFTSVDTYVYSVVHK